MPGGNYTASFHQLSQLSAAQEDKALLQQQLVQSEKRARSLALDKEALEAVRVNPNSRHRLSCPCARPRPTCAD